MRAKAQLTETIQFSAVVGRSAHHRE